MTGTDDVRRVTTWIEQHIGGTVTSIVREGRWRPSWVAEVEREGSTRSLHIRGDRGHGYSYPISYEAAILGVLERNGIPVPHVHGMCDVPVAMVMDHVPGTGQLTGVDDPAAQRAIIDQYAEILVAIHAIDVEQFEAVGVRNPRDPIDLQLSFHRDRRRVFHDELKSRPEPFVEFVEGWLARRVPTNRSARSFVTFDAGQFLVHEGRVTALYDFEISHINDPLADLAGLRVRNTFEPLGDIGYLLGRYQQLTGAELDLDVINFHTVVLALAANQAIARLITQPVPDAINWRVWEVSGSRICISAMADVMGLELEDPELPGDDVDHGSVAVRAMTAAVDAIETSDAYRHGLASNLARHLALVERFGADLDAANLDDVAELLGRRPSSIADADQQLEAFVLEAGPEDDERLLALFHRRTERLKFLLPDFDPAAAAAGDVGPHLDRCRLRPLRSELASGATS